MKSGYLFFLGTIMLCACNTDFNKKERKSDDGVSVRVTHRMGELPSDTIQYLPLIGSLAEGKDEEDKKNQYLIIGKDLDNGDNLRVYPLSTLVFESGNVEQKLKLSVPTSEKFSSIKVRDFEEFATNYASIKIAIENWYNHFGGLGNSKFLRWEYIGKE